MSIEIKEYDGFKPKTTENKKVKVVKKGNDKKNK